MNRTAQQTAFIDALLNTSGHLCLRARAGTGKTTTILEAVDDYVAKYPRAEITICAFGKAIQREIADKLVQRGHSNWKSVQASTSHSMGWGLVRFVFKSEIDDNKVRDMIKARNEGGVFIEYRNQIRDLVHLAKTEGFGFFGDVQIGDKRAWYTMAEHYDVNGLDDTSQMDEIVEAAQTIYRASLDKTDVIDFDDMILFPLVKNLRVRFQRDLILLDEAQDTSRARRALIRKFLKPSGRLMIIGDDRQAIMGFAGASADALTELVTEMNATVLPLNVTWRCPKAVVAEAQRLVPDIQAADEAIEGSVTRVDALPDIFNVTDAILCRNTAPLISTAYALIRRGVACKVEGRDIGVGLLRMVDRWTRITTITAFLDRLEDYRAREIQKAQAKGHDAKIVEIGDRCDTLTIICDAVRAKNLHSLDDVRAFIGNLFQDDVKASGMVTLCSYHRSKGREWPRVMLLEHAARCPSPYDRQPWQFRQSENLCYVAVTRAQQELVFVN